MYNFFAFILLQTNLTDNEFGLVDWLIKTIIQDNPLVALLILFLGIFIYLYIKSLKENKELNQYIRDNEKDNLETLNKLSNTLEKLTDSQKNSDESVLKEISVSKDFIGLKIDNLSDKVSDLKK